MQGAIEIALEDLMKRLVLGDDEQGDPASGHHAE
jgi:hypothetical protein